MPFQRRRPGKSRKLKRPYRRKCATISPVSSPVQYAAALLPPSIWGPAHGLFLTLLWYPVWLFADNLFFAAYSVGSTFSYIAAILAFVILTLFTFYFAYAIQPRAALYCIERGKTKEQFQRRQKIWAVVGIIVGILMLAFATYYNLCLRAPMGA